MKSHGYYYFSAPGNLVMMKQETYPKYLNKPLGSIGKNDFLGGGLFKGRAYLKGGLFQTLAFSSKTDIKSQTIFSHKYIKNFTKANFISH